MDPWTEQARSWLDRRYARLEDGSYRPHQPIDGLATVASEPNALLRMARTYQVLSLVRRLVFSSAVDVGGGEGYLAGLVRQMTGERIEQADISVEACRRAREIFGIDGYAADAARLPFSDGSYDLVLSSEVIEHLARPLVALSEMVRVARRYVVITTEEACLTGELERRIRLASLAATYPHAERNWFTPGDFRLLFGASALAQSQRRGIDRRTVEWLSRHRWTVEQARRLLEILTSSQKLDCAHAGLIVLIDKTHPRGQELSQPVGSSDRDASSTVMDLLLGASSIGDGMVFSRAIDPIRLDNLRCVTCRGGLRLENEELVCVACKRRFPVRAGVPDFMGGEWDRQAAESEAIERLAGPDPARKSLIRARADLLHARRRTRVGRTQFWAPWLLRVLLFVRRPESMAAKLGRVTRWARRSPSELHLELASAVGDDP